jgi:hypothetical protein
VKQPGLACRHAALRVGEFEVATSGGIWVAIRVHSLLVGVHISAQVVSAVSEPISTIFVGLVMLLAMRSLGS